MPDLRDYQVTAVAALRDSLRAGHQPLYVLPTGGGKTVIFSHIATQAAARGTRVGILMHRQELIAQTSRALGCVPHGIIRAGVTPTYNAGIQIASIQTLVRRTDRYKFDLLIFDEAHHCTASMYQSILSAYPLARVIGVTATPCRTDGTGLRDAGFDDLILGPTTSELTARGYLTPAEVFAPGGIDVHGVGTARGDYNRGALAAAADKPVITGCAVSEYRRHAAGLPAIAFCVSVAHAEHVAEMFQQAGYTAASIDGKMATQQRAGLITALGNGSLNVLCSCDLISEGVDVPVVVAGIMLRPTQSRGLWIQQMGRVLRPAPGKARAIILDHAGNTARHGLPTTTQDWSLDGLKASTDTDTERAPSFRICPSCMRPHESAPVCPYCSFIYPIQARELTIIEGELQRIEQEAERVEARREVGRAETLEQLQQIAAERGYQPGWAYHRWHARQNRRAIA